MVCASLAAVTPPSAAPTAVSPPPFEALWDAYLLSVADLGRWMAGWGWWGNRGMDEIIQGVLDRLDGGQALASEEQYADAARREFGHI